MDLATIDSNHPLKLAFIGSSAFALPALETLIKGPDQIVLTISAPPAPAGRGRQLKATPVSQAATKAGLKLLETAKINSPDSLEAIKSVQPNLLIVCAFGGFLGLDLLSLGLLPPINIHPSILPKHRGAAPVNWALINGDQEVGVSIIFLERQMDAGPILSQTRRPVPPGASAGHLETLLAEDAAKLLRTTLDDIKNHNCHPKLQDDSLATVNRLLEKQDGQIDFHRPASELASLINGVDPWPGAKASFNNQGLKLFGALAQPGQTEIGKVTGVTNGRLIVGTGQGLLAIAEMQPEGKKRLSASDFFNGYHPSLFN